MEKDKDKKSVDSREAKPKGENENLSNAKTVIRPSAKPSAKDEKIDDRRRYDCIRRPAALPHDRKDELEDLLDPGYSNLEIGGAESERREDALRQAQGDKDKAQGDKDKAQGDKDKAQGDRNEVKERPEAVVPKRVERRSVVPQKARIERPMSVNLRQVVEISPEAVQIFRKLKGLNRSEKALVLRSCKKIRKMLEQSDMQQDVGVYQCLLEILETMQQDHPDYDFSSSQNLLQQYAQWLASRIDTLNKGVDRVGEYLNERLIGGDVRDELKRQGVPGVSANALELYRNVEQLLYLYQAQKSLDDYLEHGTDRFDEPRSVRNRKFNRLDQPSPLRITPEHLEQFEIETDEKERLREKRKVDFGLGKKKTFSTPIISDCVNLIVNAPPKRSLAVSGIGGPIFTFSLSTGMTLGFLPYVMYPWLALNLVSALAVALGYITFSKVIKNDVEHLTKVAKDRLPYLRNRVAPDVTEVQRLHGFHDRISSEKKRLETQMGLMDGYKNRRQVTEHKKAQIPGYENRLAHKYERVCTLLSSIDEVLNRAVAQLEEKVFMLTTQMCFNRKPKSIETGKSGSFEKELTAMQKQFDELLLEKEILENEGL